MNKPVSCTPEADAGNLKPLAHDNNTIAPFGDKRDVAWMIKQSVRSVDNHIAAGMPHMKIGNRRCRFDLAAVREWMLAQYGQQRRRVAPVPAHQRGGVE